MKNILFLHSSSELYGSDRSLLNLLKNLDRSEFNLSVILPCDGPLVEEIKKLNDVNIIIQELAILRRKNLNIKGIFSYIKDLFKSINFLKGIITENNVDVVYTNTSVVFPGGITAKLLGKKSVWHIREIISNKFERKVVSFIVNTFSDVIIANSKSTGEAITKNNKKVKVVYNAIESKPEAKKHQKIDDTIVIGMAGRINRWKGQKLFIDMAKDILNQTNNVKFKIAGDVYKGEEHILEDIKLYVKEKNIEEYIEFLGQVNNMDKFYNSIDIFILPSIQPEPFGLVVIEAMEKELPVVATNHGGPTEIIDNGIDGYLVDYTNSKEMSNRTLELIKDIELRKEIGKRAKEKRNRIFNIEKYVKDISKILIQV
ncbi:glycosyltransferase family 4 protein [Romboutsia ilealis]|uniref:glycosyltransferase family 4 protein n=1 Tax=Romboutsia ilealis TaxID=1115758 RepID=UPI00272B42D8|nr:glycosyltransferase family 4 protein [Romboutsia ilealis]